MIKSDSIDSVGSLYLVRSIHASFALDHSQYFNLIYWEDYAVRLCSHHSQLYEFIIGVSLRYDDRLQLLIQLGLWRKAIRDCRLLRCNGPIQFFTECKNVDEHFGSFVQRLKLLSFMSPLLPY